jgi:hypothetical protein
VCRGPKYSSPEIKGLVVRVEPEEGTGRKEDERRKEEEKSKERRRDDEEERREKKKINI